MSNTRYRRGKLYAADMAVYTRQMAADNSAELSRLKRNLIRALKEDVTPRQREVLTLYYAVAHWNDFFTALLYISDESLMPMQVLLRRVLIQSSSELIGNMATDDKAAASIQIRYVTIVVATLPILVIYPLLQRYFVKGVMLGAVKG